ncbi:Uncharacterised protein [Escherichia coli]|uniref:Uncharacterized protein n=1 Tax=Escherichia coli TaxID=562 RepID=A0A377AX43_ECOLX|nr:Uncharacterised protein [Escherichia coli]
MRRPAADDKAACNTVPTATSSEAEELNPAPCGTLPLITMSTPPKLLLRSCRCFTHATNVVSPLIVFHVRQWAHRGKTRRADFHNRLPSRELYGHRVCTTDHGLIINRAGQNETVVVVGVFTNQIHAARRLNGVSGQGSQMRWQTEIGVFSFRLISYTPDSRKWISLTARKRSAAVLRSGLAGSLPAFHNQP